MNDELIRSTTIEIRRQSELFFNTPYLQDFLDKIPAVVAVLNRRREIVFTNQAAREIFRATETGDTLGMRTGEAMNCHHAVAADDGCGTTEYCPTCGAFQAILQSLEGETANRECRLTQQDGQPLDIKVHAAPFQIAGGSFITFTVTDISHEKRRRALERIFFHDIANTIGALSGFSQLLGEAAPGDRDELEREISILSDRLVEELNAQRDLAAAENNELAVNPEDINPRELLEEVGNRYRHHDVAAGKKIVLGEVAAGVTLKSDRILLSRVLGNMVKNALEASAEGDTVRIGCETADGWIAFHVANPGVIPPEAQLQIFQRSFTTKGTGRGLGTYSMKMLTERYLKGRISFTSNPDDGTVFTARYPLSLDAGT